MRIKKLHWFLWDTEPSITPTPFMQPLTTDLRIGTRKCDRGNCRRLPREISQVLKQLEKCGPKKVVIAPLMIVAGDHAKNDMAGDEPDSWKTIISQKGYEVQTVLKGLGEYESIRHIFVEHAKAAK